MIDLVPVKSYELMNYRELVLGMAGVHAHLLQCGRPVYGYEQHCLFVKRKSASFLYSNLASTLYDRYVTDKVLSGEFCDYPSSCSDAALEYFCDTYRRENQVAYSGQNANASMSSKPWSGYPYPYCFFFNECNGCLKKSCALNHECGYCHTPDHRSKECSKSQWKKRPSADAKSVRQSEQGIEDKEREPVKFCLENDFHPFNTIFVYDSLTAVMKLIPDLPNVHYIAGVRSQLKPKAWLSMLTSGSGYDPDIRYLLEGVVEGLKVIDHDANIHSYNCRNYGSCWADDNCSKLQALLQSEVNSGKLSPVSQQPHCIHSLGVIKKKGSNKIRPITDCSQPAGLSVNMYGVY